MIHLHIFTAFICPSWDEATWAVEPGDTTTGGPWDDVTTEPLGWAEWVRSVLWIQKDEDQGYELDLRKREGGEQSTIYISIY